MAPDTWQMRTTTVYLLVTYTQNLKIYNKVECNKANKKGFLNSGPLCKEPKNSCSVLTTSKNKNLCWNNVDIRKPNCNWHAAEDLLWTSLRVTNSRKPSHGGEGCPHFCEFYLQAIDQVSKVNISKIPPCFWQREEKKNHFEILQRIFVKSIGPKRNYFTRA